LTFYDNVRCPVVWICYRLNEKIVVDVSKTKKEDEKPIFNMDYGWVCKCGEWVIKDTPIHKIILYGLRTGFKVG
jgi:hypothetical protein